MVTIVAFSQSYRENPKWLKEEYEDVKNAQVVKKWAWVPTKTYIRQKG